MEIHRPCNFAAAIILSIFGPNLTFSVFGVGQVKELAGWNTLFKDDFIYVPDQGTVKHSQNKSV